MQKVTEGIFVVEIPEPNSKGTVNCYLLEGDSGITIVDTGPYSKQAIRIWDQIISRNKTIDKVVLTHIHPNHNGMAGWLKSRTNAPIYMFKKGMEELLNNCLYNDSNTSLMKEFIVSHGGPPSIFPQCSESKIDFEPNKIFDEYDEIRMGDIIFTAIPTPGHSKDHVVFYNEANKIMLIGDLVAEDVSPVINVWREDDGNLLKDYLNSLKLIQNYHPHVVLPGHGKSINNLTKRIQIIVKEHLQELTEIYDCLINSGRVANDVCNYLYGNQSDVSKLSTTIAKLMYLHSIGRVQVQEINGRIYYYPLRTGLNSVAYLIRHMENSETLK
jgi:glyoxylase-like metal-dependent hydrolase (beta-lactamase superfamily II)